MGRLSNRRFLCLFFIFFISHGTSWAWNDVTHMAIAKAADYPRWYYGAAADVAKIKAGSIEEKNHYFGNDGVEITAKIVFDQASRYNNPNDTDGHLYGAIISSLREYKYAQSQGKNADYHMAYAVHYIGDLSQPLHNIAYDSYNKAHHPANDNSAGYDVMDKIGEIQKNIYEIKIRPDHFEEDLAKEVARLANISYRLGIKLRAENRDMSTNEAYVQAGHSASLLKAVLGAIDKTDEAPSTNVPSENRKEK
jgi:hypothetical protein